MGSVLVRNFAMALATILHSLLRFYLWIVIAAVVLSWVNPDPRNPIVRFIYGVTEPALYQIRRRLPFVYAGRFDLSPLVLLLGIQFIDMFLVQSLYDLAAQISAHTAGWIHAG
jgi:YggT family protein